ncbi:orotidine-5'-phosphate decarboxylase [Methylovirgula sp. 4M-Z18]|uniref:orotidine-5'-phosphate decarboxylase n=1 Tax=Methylovirgula sp. 4M-Z18 TaxID=2293567 RepID=UPI000E2E5300|nr:orotidine-5'-phosphate decarboxylase [Methylovirgula sp. 4M-Z18]RFB78161.1 orotidine-5'-phosphate decarboxylase [Methylovirgula sp. 4M-Z18]
MLAETALANLPRDRMIVALDFSSVGQAEKMVETLGDSVVFYKIGLELAYGGGLGLAERLIAAGKQVFLDLKLHDIPNTVERAAAQVGQIGASLLTVHAYPQTMRAARKALLGSNTKILAVTVMTSYDDADLSEAGYALGVSDLVARRALQAREIGIEGLILSAEEVAAMRALVGPEMLLVTPGIRPAGDAVGDQKRVVTPAAAIRAGADHLVIGRPVTQSADPWRAAQAITEEIAGALR